MTRAEINAAYRTAREALLAAESAATGGLHPLARHRAIAAATKELARIAAALPDDGCVVRAVAPPGEIPDLWPEELDEKGCTPS